MPENSSTQTRLMHFVATYLIFITVAVRTVSEILSGKEYLADSLLPLALYGLFLIIEPQVSQRYPVFKGIYLFIQSALAMLTILDSGGSDYIAALFMPVSFQAVSFFGRKVGLILVGVMSAVILAAITSANDTLSTVIPMGILFTLMNLLMAAYALLIQEAERARQANEALLKDVRKAYSRLQDYAAKVEEYSAVQERQRLARELHDSVTQTIFSMNLTVQAAKMVSERDMAQLPPLIGRLEELISSAVAEINLLVKQFRPRSLVDEGLPAALRRLVEERCRRDGLQIELVVRGEKVLPEAVTSGIYRIAQEALNNIAKHSGAHQAELRLDLSEEQAYLEVEDHGRGFNLGSIERNLEHVGLFGMAERASEIGWRLQIDSTPGSGSKIRIEEQKA